MENFDFGWLQERLGVIVLIFLIFQIGMGLVAWRNLSKRAS